MQVRRVRSRGQRHLFTGIAVCSMLLAPPARAQAAPADVRQWAQAYDEAALSGPGVDAAGRTLAFGQLELKLRSGRLYPVVVAGSVSGIFFDGAGSLRYVSGDALGDATYRLNVERVTSYRVDAGGAVSDEFERALVLLSSGAEALAGEAGWPAGTAAAESARALAKHRERWRDDLALSPRQLLAQAALDPPAEAAVVAQIQAARHDRLFVRETLRHVRETLAALTKSDVDFLGPRRVASSLDVRPIGRDRLTPAPEPSRLIDLDASVVNPRGEEARVALTQTFELTRPARTLALALESSMLGNPNATAGKAWRPYRLERVTDGDGRELAFAQRDEDLVIDLGRQADAGRRIVLSFTLSGDVLVRPEGDNYWALLGAWYALPASARRPAFAYHAVVKTPKPFVPFSAGATVRRWDEGDLACAEFRETEPVNSAFVLAGKYTTYQDERTGPLVSVSTYGHAKTGASKQIAGLARAFVEFFEPLLGPFPFAELNVIEINAYGFGIAPPGVVFITKEAFGANPVADQWANVTVKGINQRLAHEVAHAWWGNSVLPTESQDTWMGESLAEYYSALAMMLRDKKDFDWALAQWKHESKARGSVYLANFLAGDDAWRDRQRLLYSRGPLFLHALRAELGDQAFFTAFKSLASSFPRKPAGTRDVLAIARLVTGKDQRALFDRYLFGTEVPAVVK